MSTTSEQPPTHNSPGHRAVPHGGRLETFSDGVFAIITTIMVLDLKVPKGEDFAALLPLAPTFCCYVLSFVYVGIYWNNHHHMLHAAQPVSGAALWANLHLLFWLSLFPFMTGWLGEKHFATAPTALYGMVLLAAAIAYYLLQRALISAEAAASLLRRAVGTDWKGKLSPVPYPIAIALSFGTRYGALAIDTLVALIWFVPDQRIEQALRRELPAP
jgi:uncharacterized membrane protein